MASLGTPDYETPRFYVSRVIVAMNEALMYYKTLKHMFCGVPPSDLSRNMDIDHRGVLTWIYDTNLSSRWKYLGQYFVGRRSWDCVIWHHSCSYFNIKEPYFAKILDRNIECSCIFYCWWVLSDCAIRETWVPRGMASLRQANLGNDMKKYSLPLIFTFYLDKRHIGARIIPCHCISIKRILIAAGIETVSKIVGLRYREKDPKWRSYRHILLQTRTHILTINQHDSV